LSPRHRPDRCRRQGPRGRGVAPRDRRLPGHRERLARIARIGSRTV